MTDVLSLLGRAFLLGVAVAAPVGAMSALTVQRTISSGWRRGMATGVGIATADAMYALAAALGLAVVAPVLARWAVPLQIAGGLVLVWLGIKALRTASHGEPLDVPQRAGGAYASAVALTLANPATIAAFAAALTAIGVLAGDGWRSALIAALGVGAGSLSWWIGLVTLTSLARSRMQARGLRTLARVTAGGLSIFGVLMIGRALLALV